MGVLDFHREEPALRVARSGEALGIADVQFAAWQRAYRGLVPDAVLDTLSVHELTSGWRRWIEEGAPSRVTWIAEVAGRVRAFASIGPTRDQDADARTVGELYAFYVHPEVWRLRIGTELEARARRELLERGFLRATLWVLEHNRRGRAFYERIGWQLEGSIKGCFDGRTPAIRYERWLR